ncbi:Hypothetical protein I5071_37940 [Sandaracinus amylolyticus]|nr:Hypothetical protein I5071_37940 [Sandaracinus amylolyticus]
MGASTHGDGAAAERVVAHLAARVGLNDIERRVIALSLAGVAPEALPAQLGVDPSLAAAALRVACVRLEIDSVSDVWRLVARELGRS